MKELPICYAPPASPRDQVRHAAMDKIPIILRLNQAARDTLISSSKVKFFCVQPISWIQMDEQL